MTIKTASSETFTADPVVVEMPDAETPSAVSPRASVESLLAVRARRRSGSPVGFKFSRPDPDRLIYSDNNQGKSLDNRPVVIENTQSLESILDGTDICVRRAGDYPFYMMYITSHGLHHTDVDRISWLLNKGYADTWVQNLPAIPSVIVNSRDEYLERGRRSNAINTGLTDSSPRNQEMAMARLGASLRVFKEGDPRTSRVKFIVAVESKLDPSWSKLMVCYTRQSALTTIVHQILCDRPITFVGAVLQNAHIPACFEVATPHMRFEWAASYEDMVAAPGDWVSILC